MKMVITSPGNSTTTNDVATDKSISPSSSPRSSPRPSPRPQNKRDHSKSDTYLSVNYKEQPFKHEGSPSSQEGSISGRLSQTENSPPSDQKGDNSSVISASAKGSKEGRSKKKSSWFNSFYPTYKSRSEDFKRIFKDVPDDERLVVDYSCALQKEILIQGRLYVTQNYLCFYANILSWETTVTLKWKEVAAITKEKTALVIPNAVLILTRTTTKYFFTSFVARDKTYLMLFRVWQNALMDQPMSAQEMWQWVHQSYGSELGLTSDDEDYIAPGTEDEKLPARISLESEYSDHELGHDPLMGMEDDDGKIMIGPRSTGQDSQNPTDMSDNSESDCPEKPITMRVVNSPSDLISTIPIETPLSTSPSYPKQPATPESDDTGRPFLGDSKAKLEPRCTSTHEGRQLLNEVFPIHLDQLFTQMFTSSKFYLDFHAARKTTDLTQTPWTHNPLDNSKSRVVNQTISLSNTMGPKSAQVTETQMMLPCSKAGHLYAIDVETVNAGVPYADSFCVLVHYCLHKVSETRSSLVVYAQIKYKKSVWGLVKGMIEKNCWSGLDDFFAAFGKALHLECEEFIPEKRKSRRKRRIHSTPRLTLDDSRLIVPGRKRSSSGRGLLSSEVVTGFVFAVLIVLLFLNCLLYMKLWSLEDSPPFNMDVQIVPHLPKTHDEWIELLQKQETLHTIEVKKWQKVLKHSVDLLKQVEGSLTELQITIQPVTSKIVNYMQNPPDTQKEL